MFLGLNFFCTKITIYGSSTTLIFFLKPTGMEKVNDVVIPIFSEPHGSMFKFAHAADGTFNDGQGKKNMKSIKNVTKLVTLRKIINTWNIFSSN